MKKILSMILLLCAAFSVQLRAEEFTEGNPVYIQGKAANADWGTTDEYLTEMTHLGNGVYTWTGALKQDAFRFVCEAGNGWKVMAFEAKSNGYGVSGGYLYPVDYQKHDADKNFSVSEAGNYRLILDTQDKILIVQKADDTKIYAIGDEFGGWNKGQAVALTEGENLKYTYKAKLENDKYFRFSLNNGENTFNQYCRIASAYAGDGDVAVNSSGVGVSDSRTDRVYCFSANEGNWHVTEAGYYTLTLDLVARKLSVTYTPATINAVAEASSSEYYATFSSSYGNMALTGTNLEIYDVTVDGNKLNLTQHTGTLVAQGEGVLVKASAAQITAAPTNQEVTAHHEYGTSTLLVATPGIKQEVTPDGEYTLYRLTYNKPTTYEGLGFFSTTSENIQAQPGKAYLKVPTSQSASLKGFLINPQPTGVDAIGVDADCDNTIYDLCGRRVENPSNGIYIQNGKKIFVK
ncbi:MAG: SusF/SusE family outer membrane protein [Bacteroidales bacterium]|nr:SusF/SusE family outer membrane protein [Bacteroidales bacterium]